MNYWQENLYTEAVGNELSFVIPHCPVVLVLDTSHSMWGQGLVDLKNSLKAFYHSLNQEIFQEAEIDIETIRMGENFGIMEEFTPIANSTLLNTAIRPKGDTPLGASLELAIAEIDRQMSEYRKRSICSVTPQLIVLSDGKSSDDFRQVAADIRNRIASSGLICRAIALGDNPDKNALMEFAGESVISPMFGNLPDTFREVGRVLSQEYEDSAVEIITNEAESAIIQSESEEMYLLDGTNMLHWDKERHGITLQYVLNVTEYLQNSGKKYVVYFDASTPHILRKDSPNEGSRYEELLKKAPENFRQVPAGTRADDILLIEADQNSNAIILSQDRYRDYSAQYRWLLDNDKKRVVPGMVLSDKIFFPAINLKVPIKSLENFEVNYL